MAHPGGHFVDPYQAAIMKISELRKRLDVLQLRHGDQEVEISIKLTSFFRGSKYLYPVVIFAVGKSGRQELKEQIVIFGVKKDG